MTVICAVDISQWRQISFTNDRESNQEQPSEKHECNLWAIFTRTLFCFCLASCGEVAQSKLRASFVYFPFHLLQQCNSKNNLSLFGIQNALKYFCFDFGKMIPFIARMSKHNNPVWSSKHFIRNHCSLSHFVKPEKIGNSWFVHLFDLVSRNAMWWFWGE